MKKELQWLSTMMLVLMAMPLMVACGGGDDDNVNGKGGNSTSTPDGSTSFGKFVTAIDCQQGDKTLSYVFSYDSEGRVLTRRSLTSSFINRFLYSENYIKVERELSGHYYEYQLVNGRITTCETYQGGTTPVATYVFSYDNKGQIETVRCHLRDLGTTDTREFSWKEGNLTDMIWKDTDSIHFEYTNIKAPDNYIPVIKFPNSFEPFGMGRIIPNSAFLLRFMGIKFNYLIKKTNVNDNNNYYEESNYDYTMKDGYPIEVRITPNFNAQLTWN